MQQQKFGVETHQANVDTIGVLEEANAFTKEEEDVARRLEDHAIATREQKMANNEIEERMREMAEDDDALEEADVLLWLFRTYLRSCKGR